MVWFTVIDVLLFVSTAVFSDVRVDVVSFVDFRHPCSRNFNSVVPFYVDVAIFILANKSRDKR